MNLLDSLVEREKAYHRGLGYGSLLRVKTLVVSTADFFVDFGNDSGILLEIALHPSVVTSDISAANILLMSDVDVRQGHLVNPSYTSHFLIRRFLTGTITTNDPIHYPIGNLPVFPLMIKVLNISPIK